MKTRSPSPEELPARGHFTRLSAGSAFPSTAFKQILVPLDFPTDSKHALRCAVGLARQLGANLTLLHVVEPLVSHADFGYGYITTRSPDTCVLKQTQTALNSLANRLASSRLQPLAVVRTGKPETEIVQAATDFAADLIIIGSHGRSPFPIPIGSTSEKVVRNAPCPVLVVRRSQSQTARSAKRGAS